MTRKIDWRHIDEKTFNELVETFLVQEETREGRRAMALDGRGGDGGIDVDVRVEQTNQLTHIYQLKYFHGGMSGGHIARRSQVKKSLSAALKSEPSQGWAWTLVLPFKVTAPERKAVRALRPGSKPEIRFMGPPELDRLLGLHPEIERRFTADYAVEVLREVHRESAALTRPDDLAAEATRLHDRLDGRSAYWGIAFGVDPDGSVRETVFAKRDDAQEREPLSVNLSLQFGPESEAQRKAFSDAMNYGVVEKVELTSYALAAAARVRRRAITTSTIPSIAQRSAAPASPISAPAMNRNACELFSRSAKVPETRYSLGALTPRMSANDQARTPAAGICGADAVTVRSDETSVISTWSVVSCRTGRISSPLTFSSIVDVVTPGKA
ncbi:hypothetical protein [Frigoribacterium sp. Leaf44]|uniref:hypothetical protein n=1 Tax=Frigoribacterium sp. Leaf44 TaxID=1736220 RepID=UPI0012FB7605|nr:hypothetical protein [Frigoribacterium sp. Leaf44]